MKVTSELRSSHSSVSRDHGLVNDSASSAMMSSSCDARPGARNHPSAPGRPIARQLGVGPTARRAARPRAAAPPETDPAAAISAMTGQRWRFAKDHRTAPQTLIDVCTIAHCPIADETQGRQRHKLRGPGSRVARGGMDSGNERDVRVDRTAQQRLRPAARRSRRRPARRRAGAMRARRRSRLERRSCRSRAPAPGLPRCRPEAR